jgi:alpha-beta hydrolase superfamily lysophospholipase
MCYGFPMRPVVRHLAFFVGYGTLGVLAAVLTTYVLYLTGRPALKAWHLEALDAEFRAADAPRVKNLEDYRRIEDALRAQLDARVYAKVGPGERRVLERYSPGSLSDPRALAPDWNRTVELRRDGARGAVLLLHGLSDSPYSMRALAERLHARGFWVAALRLPGHGTAPSGLVEATWQDWAAATRIAARDLAAKVGPERPLYLVGYSNGAAVAVEYALSRLAGEELPPVRAMVLLSPAIGVSPAASLAVWQSRLAVVPGLEKLAWSDLLPEYDPYKYNSFAVNAGDQIYRLTQRIAGLLASTSSPEGVKGVPRILAFQSVADATVSTAAVVDALFRRLAPEGHELVLFDLNRHADAAPLLDPAALVVQEDLFRSPPLPFDLTAIVNESAESQAVVALRRRARTVESTREATGLEWPLGVYSLAHVALPFPPDDPVYGATPPARRKTLYLGKVELLGERGVLAVPASALLRLRHNPFFPYVERRLDAFVEETIGR